MWKATFNEEGLPTGFYDEGYPEEKLPNNAIDITDEDWLKFQDSPNNTRWYNGYVVNYDPPIPSEQVPSVISDRQFFQQLAIDDLITEEEALDAVGPGIIPEAMSNLIGQLPYDLQFGAKMMISGATIFDRGNELANIIKDIYNWSDDDMDKFWIRSSKL